MKDVEMDLVECTCCGVRVPRKFWDDGEIPMCAVCGNACYIDVKEDAEDEEVSE